MRGDRLSQHLLDTRQYVQLILRRIRLSARYRMIQICRGRLIYLLTSLTRLVLHIGRNPWAMGSSKMNHCIGLGVCRMLTRRTLERNGCILVLLLLTRMRILLMNRRKMMQIGRLLEKSRLILALLTLKRKILLMFAPNMVMHRVLLPLNFVTVRANKTPFAIASVFDRNGLCYGRMNRNQYILGHIG